MPSPTEVKREVSKIEGSKGKEKDFYRSKRKSAFVGRHGAHTPKQLMVNGLAKSG